jgi:hypothetical protein
MGAKFEILCASACDRSCLFHLPRRDHDDTAAFGSSRPIAPPLLRTACLDDLLDGPRGGRLCGKISRKIARGRSSGRISKTRVERWSLERAVEMTTDYLRRKEDAEFEAALASKGLASVSAPRRKPSRRSTRLENRSRADGFLISVNQEFTRTPDSGIVGLWTYAFRSRRVASRVRVAAGSSQKTIPRTREANVTRLIGRCRGEPISPP